MSGSLSAIAAAVMLLGAGCGGNPSGSTFAGIRLPKECKRAAVEHAKRRCVAWFLHEIAGGRRSVYADRKLSAYVTQVGMRIARQAKGDRTRWKFLVIDDAARTASTVGGGYVYVTRGALAALRSEAELAALLSHEIAHGLAGHGDDFINGIKTDREERPERERYAYERDRERHADELAATLLMRAGYAPSALVDMFERILRFESKRDVSQAFRSHPLAHIRVARASRVIGKRSTGRVGRCSFLKRISGLVLGHDPRNGYVYDRTYLISAVRLAFDVRRDWTYEQKGRRLEIWNDKRSVRALVLQVNRFRAAALTASLSGRSKTRIGGHRAEMGWMKIDSTKSPLRFNMSFGEYWARVAVIRTRTRNIVALVAGRGKRGMARLFRTLLRPRTATNAEMRKPVPKRLATTRLRRSANCRDAPRR